MRPCVGACVPACLPACLPACVRACVRACVPTFLMQQFEMVHCHLQDLCFLQLGGSLCTHNNVTSLHCIRQRIRHTTHVSITVPSRGLRKASKKERLIHIYRSSVCLCLCVGVRARVCARACMSESLCVRACASLCVCVRVCECIEF